MKLETFGVPELDALWKQLSDTQKRNVEISNWRKASKPMLSAIKTNASSMHGKVTGNLARSIGSSPVRGAAILQLGARRFGNWKGYHAHLVSDGTKERFTESGASRGKVDGSKFFDLGYQSTEKQVVDEYRKNRIETFHRFIQRANRKLAA